MDGGRRFLRSLKEQLFPPLSPAVLRPAGDFAGPAPVRTRALSRSRWAPEPSQAPARRKPRDLFSRLARKAAFPGAGLLALMLLFAGAGALGFVHSGGYADMVAKAGEPYDAIARALGFPIAAVTISGEARLREGEILAATGIDARNSLLFLDAAGVRRRLLELPLVKSARVLKLYPDRLVIAIEEREPAALWQHDGKIKVVAADGTAIDELTDGRFLGLPFVVGEGADKRLAQFGALLKQLGDLSQRLKAGVFVAERRWSLIMTNGVEVKLPERDPGAAIETLLRLQREARILDKDIMSIDLRLPQRITIRLTEEGAEARAAATARKPAKSGAHT
jgi:cell division protein FtsQ